LLLPFCLVYFQFDSVNKMNGYAGIQLIIQTDAKNDKEK